MLTTSSVAINNLEKEGTCPVCQELYHESIRIPHVLSCGHTLCAPCLAEITYRTVACRNDFLKCPHCNCAIALGTTIYVNYAALGIANSFRQGISQEATTSACKITSASTIIGLWETNVVAGQSASAQPLTKRDYHSVMEFNESPIGSPLYDDRAELVGLRSWSYRCCNWGNVCLTVTLCPIIIALIIGSVVLMYMSLHHKI